MDKEESTQFLKEFREKIDKYLFLGYSPPDSHFGGEGSKKMRKALKDPEFQHLRDAIMDMEPKVLNILEECGIKRYITFGYYGQDVFIKFTLFELVWRNYSPYNSTLTVQIRRHNLPFFFQKMILRGLFQSHFFTYAIFPTQVLEYLS